MINAASYASVVWRGGKLVVLYKGKGSPSACDSYRGLLIADHVANVLTTLLQWHVNDSYKSQVGETQFDGVSSRSTSIASLMLRCYSDACRPLSWSYFIFFADLSKAFDDAVREVFMG